MDDDYRLVPFLSTIELAAAIKSRLITSRQVLEVLLARCKRLNDPLNAVIYIDAERARRRADQADAALAAKMWRKHPSYKMTLAATQQGVDVNNDGLIDKDEFKELLAASGYRGAAAAELFRQMDKDGDGTLTEAEIKLLSQGSATLQSSG